MFIYMNSDYFHPLPAFDHNFLLSLYKVETVSAEVQDEAAYKRTKLAMFRTNKTHTA